MSQFNASENATDPRQQLDRALAFMRRVRHFGWVIGAAVLLGALACAVFFMVRTPRYLSETVLLYNEGIRTGDQNSQPLTPPKNASARLKEMLLARPLLMRVIQEHQLYQDVVKEQGLVDAVDEFRKDLEFKAPGGDTYTIGFRTDSAEKAQKVTRHVAELLIVDDAKLRKAQAKMTRDFLAGEAKRTTQELKDTELELAKFMAEHPGFAMDTMLLAGAPAGAAIRASAGNNRNDATAADAKRAAGTWQTLGAIGRVSGAQGAQAGPAPQAGGPMVDRAERARAEAALAAAQTDLADKSNRFTEEHPDVKAAKATVERAQQRLAALSSPAGAAPAAPGAAGASDLPRPRRIFVPSQAGAPADRAKSAQTEDLVALETDWQRLTRSVNEARERHDQIEASFFKADIADSSESGGHGVQVQVIDPAYLPLKPLPPGRGIIAAIFIALSLIVGSIVAIACAVFDDRIYDAHDAASISSILTEVPSASRNRRAHAHA
jgi:uncharacterized protein involved in exopolysaccharide biosynthesis